MSGAPAYLGSETNVPAGAAGNNSINAADVAANYVSKATPKLKETANGPQGAVALVAGAKVVANTSVTANSRIFLTGQADGGTPGSLRVSARTPGTSFTITSSSGTDTSTVAYQIFEPDA